MRVTMKLLPACLALLAFPALAQMPAQAPAPAGYKAAVTFYANERRKPADIVMFRGVLLFKVTLGGRDAWMMLDNGADRSLIDAKLLDPLGIRSEAREGRTIRTPTGTLPYRVALEVPLVIPGQLEIRMPMAAVDLSAFSAALGHPIDAVLGADLLHNVVLALDPGRGELQLMSVGARVDLPSPPIALAKGKAQFGAEVGGKPVQLTIDLGFSGELSLSPEAWARVGPPEASKESRPSAHIEGQAFSIDHASLPAVGIGGVERTNVGVDIRPIPGRDGDGWIGMGLISQFIMVMDVTAGKLWLVPRSPAPLSAAAKTDAVPASNGAPRNFRADFRLLPGAKHVPTPFKFFGGLIFFNAKIGDRDVTMMLDNRASNSLIDAALVKSLGLTVLAQEGKTIRTPTGSLRYDIVPDVPLLIPSELEAKTPMAAVDLAPIAKTMSHPVNAVLGGDLLGIFRLVIDPGSMTIELAATGAAPTAAMQPLPLVNARPQIDLAVAGKPIRVTIDLGYNGVLALTPEAWARVAPKEVLLTTAYTAHGEGQVYAHDRGVLPQIELGGLVRRDVKVDVRPGFSDDGDGTIGMGLIGQFVTWLDIKAGKIWLMPLQSVGPISPPVAPAPTAPVSARRP